MLHLAKQIMSALDITASYDTAKPQRWMDEMVRMGFDRTDLYNNYVWLYDKKAHIHGRPFNLAGEYMKVLPQLLHDKINGECITDTVTVKMESVYAVIHELTGTEINLQNSKYGK